MQNSNSGQLNPDPKEDAPWYMKYGVRAVGTGAGGLALLLGAISVIGSILTFSPFCLILSMWLMVLGFGVIIIESPCCCVFVDHVQTVTTLVDSKPLIFKAAFYVFAPLPTLLFCFGLNVLFGCLGIIGTGVIYGFMALGKKADRSEMARNAQIHTPTVLPASNTQPVKVTVINDRSSVPPPKPPPPSYSDSYTAAPYTNDPSRTPMSGGLNAGWDTSYLQSATADLHYPYNNTTAPAANNPPNNAYSPFQ